MTRTAAEREGQRADLLRILEEQGPMPTGDLLALAYGVAEVQTGSPIHRQGMSDLHALERQRLVMSKWINGWQKGWGLADQAVLDEHEDAVDIERQRAGWQAAT